MIMYVISVKDLGAQIFLSPNLFLRQVWRFVLYG